MQEFSSLIVGMSCQSCKARVEKKLSGLAGVHSVDVSIIRSHVVVHYDENMVKPEVFVKSIENLGYKCVPQPTSHSSEMVHSHNEKGQHDGHHMSDPINTDLMSLSMDMDIMGMDHGEEVKVSKWQTLMMWLNLSFAIIVMILAMVPGLASGYVQWVLATVIAGTNFHMLKTGFKGLRHWSPNMYSLVFLGAVSGYVYSLVALVIETFSPGYMMVDMFFFDATAAILSFLAVGDFAQNRGTELVRKNLGNVQNDFPAMVTKIVDGKEEMAPLAQIRVGDKILVKVGEMIAFDGVLESDGGQVVETLLTGEITAVNKNKGDTLTSGTHAKNFSLTMTVLRPLQEGFFYKVRASLIDIEQKKTPVLDLVDRISYYFVPIVIILSVVGFLFWGFFGDSWIFALKVAISILVIACPCALGLATPFAIMIFFGTAFKGGFLLRNSRILSFAKKLDSCIMDKTGTLTMGQLSVVKWGVLDLKDINSHIFTMENQSTHPYARAILKYLTENFDVSVRNIQDFRIEEGMGISGQVDGQHITLGNSRIIALTLDQRTFEEQVTRSGQTVLWVQRDEKNMGYIVLEDSLREGVKEWVNFAKRHYKPLEILSGDNTASVAFVAKELEISQFSGNLKPFDKLQKLEELQKQGHHVLMVGDGINDSLVLAKADLSLSLGEKTNLGGQSGDIISLTGNLKSFITMLKFSTRTNHIIMQNLFWAFCYNLFAIPWALGLFVPLGWGFVNPMIGALGMATSSLIVVGNSLRLIRFRG